MSKFLESIEQNMPSRDIDTLTAAKRDIQRLLSRKGVSISSRVFADVLTITLEDGRTVELEVKNVKQPNTSEVEDAEDPTAAINTITAIASLPDQGLGKQLTSPSARKLQNAKRKMADAADKIATKFSKAAQ